MSTIFQVYPQITQITQILKEENNDLVDCNS